MNSPDLQALDMHTANIIEQCRTNAANALDEAKRLRGKGQFKQAAWRYKWAKHWMLMADAIFAETVLPAPIPARNGAAFAKAAGAAILAFTLTACAGDCATREEGSARPERVKPSQAEIDAQQRYIEEIWEENRQKKARGEWHEPVHINAQTGKPWSEADEQKAREQWGKR